MIAIPRALAGLFRAVVRKSVLAADPRGPTPLVLLQGGSAGLTLSCSQADVSVRHHSPGRRPSEKLALPLSALEAFEGRGDGLVVLEEAGPFKLKASRKDGTVSRVAEFDTATADSARSPPQAADNAVEMPAGFLDVLAEAGRTTSKEAGRYNLARVLLRGKDGSVVATDGRQLLIQPGFPLPWADNLLIPRLPVFEGRELPGDQPFRIGQADEHITLEVGPWLFRVKAEKAERYPDVNSVVPRAREAKGRLRIDPEDVPALLQALPRLPGARETHSPVTLDAGEPIVIRARGRDGPAAEVLLRRSKREGPPLRLSFGRLYLTRALRLGFTEIVFSGLNRPLLCKDIRRTFCWMPLDESSVVQAAEVQPTDTSDPPMPEPPTHNEPERRDVMPPSNGTTHHGNGASPVPESIDPLTEAETLRARLQEALTSAGRVIAVLRQQRKQSRAVRAAVASLRRLEDLGR